MSGTLCVRCLLHSKLCRSADEHEVTRHSRSSEEAMRVRMMSARSMVSEEQHSKKELTFDLTRQYKTLQLQSELRIETLEAQLKRMKEELGCHCGHFCAPPLVGSSSSSSDENKRRLMEVTAERDRISEEKEQEVSALNNKIEVMMKSYETIIQAGHVTVMCTASFAISIR